MPTFDRLSNKLNGLTAESKQICEECFGNDYDPAVHTDVTKAEFAQDEMFEVLKKRLLRVKRSMDEAAIQTPTIE
jgi:hypothetical protein